MARALEDAGHQITVKWWDRVYDIPGERPAHTTELKRRYEDLDDIEFYTRPETKRSCLDDLRGVFEADAVILVASDEPRKYNGANFELGAAVGWAMALGHNKPLISIGRLEKCPFYYLIIKLSTIQEVVELLEGF